MIHTTGFYASVDPGAAYTAIAALVPEPQIFVSGNDVHVPDTTPLVIFAAGGIASGGNSNFRLTAPSLRGVTRFFGAPINGLADADSVLSDPQAVVDRTEAPLPFVPREVINCEINSDPTAVRKQWVLVWFADAAPQQFTGGKVYTARATGTTTLTLGQWTACPITFDDAMPIGTISVVGLRARSSNIIAARIAFVGQWNRPGALGVTTAKYTQSPVFRAGNLGVWGTFTVDSIPQIEVFSLAADTAETFELDIALGA
jgi:hypothetical protein